VPYISNAERKWYEMALQDLAHQLLAYSEGHSGHLNYVITSIVNDWLAPHPVSYERLNAAIGALECAKQELYRRVVGPYEDYKLMGGYGDVYDSGLLSNSEKAAAT